VQYKLKLDFGKIFFNDFEIPYAHQGIFHLYDQMYGKIVISVFYLNRFYNASYSCYSKS